MTFKELETAETWGPLGTASEVGTKNELQGIYDKLAWDYSLKSPAAAVYPMYDYSQSDCQSKIIKLL